MRDAVRCGGNEAERHPHPGITGTPRKSAYADHAKDATTPSDTSVSMVAAECRSPRTARAWKGQAPHTATGAASMKHSHCQLRNCSTGTIDSTSTGTASNAVPSSRSRSCRASSVSRPPSRGCFLGGSGSAAV
ncbi:hypothetical protein SAV31267_092200 [Streptomyces avermitilis]|uniref:Uncharacterized protein n=1 Tax=Streptomyces avermitilis TaxID=33903 RepID=A0A4D4N8C4_STRAX|nr:hypothetical protein SAV31267_092200 [Streptomyces avermitilis]